MQKSTSFEPSLTLPVENVVGSEPSPITLRIFGHRSDRQEIYALRYRAYHEADLIDTSSRRAFSDAYDDLHTTKTVGAYYNDICVGSLRLAFGEGGADIPTMPCQAVFADVPQLSSATTGKIVEFTRLVVDPAITNNSLRSTLYGALVRGGMIVCNAGDADFAAIAVLPKMMKFYKFMCGFEYIAGPRPYPGVTMSTNLMGRGFRGLDARRSDRNRFFTITDAELAAARTAFSLQPRAKVA